MTDTIKDYLVGLGFAVNQGQFNKMMGQLKKFEGGAESTTAAVTKGMLGGATAIIGFIAAVNKGIADMLIGLANADMETQKFARRMWMSYDAAKSLQGVLGAMGEDMSSLGDIAMNAELRQKFFALRAQAESMTPGGDYKAEMEKIRGITFEFMRLKLNVTYITQWDGYYLMKYLDGPLKSIKTTFKDFNDKIQKNMPEISKKIAWFLSVFTRLGIALFGIFKGVFDLINRLPTKVKTAGAAIAAVGLAMLNPFTMTIAAIAAVLLLLDDYNTYQRGGKSLFEDTWKGLDPAKKGFAGFFGEFEGINKLLTVTADLLGACLEVYNQLDLAWQKMTGNTIFGQVLKNLGKALKEVIDKVEFIVDGFVYLAKIVDGMWTGLVQVWKLLSFDPQGAGKAGQDFLDRWKGKTDDNTWNLMRPEAKSNTKGAVATVAPTYNIYGASADGVMGASNRYTVGLVRSIKPILT